MHINKDKETHIRLCYQYVPKKKLRKYNQILNKVRIRKIIDDPKWSVLPWNNLTISYLES